MQKFILIILILAGILSAKNPKNVILMISDGCGYNLKYAAHYYLHGKKWSPVYEQMDLKISLSNYAQDNPHYDGNKAKADASYVNFKPTDSAASATAYACGIKTWNGFLGYNTDSVAVKNVMEYAQVKGLATGVVTSVPFSHATPAAFGAHNISRDGYQEIGFEMVESSKLDVIIGCGHPYYNAQGEALNTPDFTKAGGEATWQKIVSGTAGNDKNNDGQVDYWTFIESPAQFAAINLNNAPDRLLGIARVSSTLQEQRAGISQKVGDVPKNENVPQLNTMSMAALNTLGKNKNGFVLMIEGGAIDWASHANESARVIEEEIEFLDAVNSVVNWVEKNSSWDETLLIISADHETGYLTGVQDTFSGWTEVQSNGAGQMPGMQWNSKSHTNTLVPFFAKGAGSTELGKYADEKDPRWGAYLDNAEVGQYLINLYR
jgi:alkaline phosphatase